jgi:hypothetical protein
LKRQLFSVLLSFCFVAGSSGLAKGTAEGAKTTSKPKLMVPTLPPPTADWPEVPPSANSPSGTASSSAVSPNPAQNSSEPAATATTPSSEAPASAPTDVSQPVVSPTGLELPSGSTQVPQTDTAAVSPPVVEQSPAQMEPHKRPVPAAYAAAAELYKQKKFPQAAKAFEAIIQSGVANVDTHLSLAYCYLFQRLYSKAVKEFEWVAKYGKNSMTLQRQCGQTASSLRTYMSGVCPAPCLKANDPRWFLKPDGKHWISVSYSRKATWIFSENHIGEYVANENGIPVLKGTCPVCGGTGRVKILKDGDPTPRI